MIGAPLAELTAIIKTFERPDCLDRLIRSVRRLYPGLQIAVADDSREPAVRDDVAYLSLPPDSGLSAGRNALLQHVETPYFLVLDDDFEFTEETRIERLLKLVARGEVSIAAGDTLDCRVRRRRRWWGSNFRISPCPYPYHGLIHREGDFLSLTSGYRRRMNGYYLCDIVPNFFVARAADVRAMGGWDERLKVSEHEEFFLRCKEQGLPVGHCPDVRVRHWRIREGDYLRFRRRDYTGVWVRKHGINVLQEMDGTTRIFGDSPYADLVGEARGRAAPGGGRIGG